MPGPISVSDPHSQEDIRQILRRSPLLAGLSADAMGAMASAMNPDQFEAGALIIRQGEPGRFFYLIASGHVQVRVKYDGASSVVVATLSPGDCIGEMSLLSGDPTSADVVAVEKTHTLTLDRSSFDILVDAQPTLLREFVRLLARRLRATDVAVKDARADEKALAQFLRETGPGSQCELIGKHPLMASLKREVDKQSKSGEPLFIFGERGSGRELVALAIHARGPRREAPVVTVECRHISDTPWGDNLFGRYQPDDRGSARAHGVCYMTLAAGGTILLKDINSLPARVQARLALFLGRKAANEEEPRPDVRLIATATSDFPALAKAGKFSAALAEAFAANSILVAPLRARKRDIPELADYFVRDHCRRLGLPSKKISDQALTRLVSYDYDIANVQELKEALERAVALADGETIEAEEIFLGAPPKAPKTGFNFLTLKTSLARKAAILVPLILRPIVAAFFAIVLYECFFGAPRGEGNLGVTLAWALWWPALALSFFFVGRLWCAVCPMALVGIWGQRLLNLKWPIPAWIKNYDEYIGMIGFVAILWVEESTMMRHSPTATGVLLTTIIAGAIGCSLLFPRRTWCRHLCPLGSFAGLCSRSALLELRPTLDVCSAKCTSHSCYKGSDRIKGCPMYNHLMFVDSNQNCILCMNCIRSCPNESPQLNLRWPASELWIQSKAEAGAGRFVGVLLALLLVLPLVQHWDMNASGLKPHTFELHRALFLSAAMWLAVVLPLFLFWIRERRLRSSGTDLVRDVFWRKVLAWGPVATAGLVGYQLAYFPGIMNMHMALASHAPRAAGPDAIWVPLLDVLRCAVMIAGFLTSFWILWKISSGAGAGEGGKRLKGHGINLFSMATYMVVLLVLMTRPQWLGL